MGTPNVDDTAVEDTSVARCPVRKLSRPGERLAPALEYVGPDRARTATGTTGPRWIVRSHEIARALIRAEDSVEQAGFGADNFLAAAPADNRTDGDPGGGRASASAMRSPILYLEGAVHRAQRKATARYFTPRITETYRPMIEALSRELVAPLAEHKAVDLSSASLKLAVQVAGRVIGLTDSGLPGMTRRLESFFAADLTERSWSPRALVSKLRGSTALLRFYYFDVRPAIRARKRQPQEDVISQLLSVGYRASEILTECVTYGAAGMVTTREFITVCVWHLLDDEEMLARYRAGDQEERVAVLHEILRLEPVAGHLYRRTTAPVTVESEGTTHDLPVGTMIDLDIRAVNGDTALVGADPLSLTPARTLATRGVGPAVMSFGDGNHRCPGAPVAMLETEIFLSQLFALDLVADGPPRVNWNDLAESYTLRSFVLRRRD